MKKVEQDSVESSSYVFRDIQVPFDGKFKTLYNQKGKYTYKKIYIIRMSASCLW
jgi:hypothetical protein